MFVVRSKEVRDVQNKCYDNSSCTNSQFKKKNTIIIKNRTN